MARISTVVVRKLVIRTLPEVALRNTFPLSTIQHLSEFQMGRNPMPAQYGLC